MQPARPRTRPPNIEPAIDPGRGRHRRRHSLLLSIGITGLVATGATEPASAAQPPADPTVIEALVAGLNSVGRAAAEGASAVVDRASVVAPGPQAVARWDGVDVHAEGARTELVGFHESTNPHALPLDSLVPVAHSHHPAVAMPTTGEDDGQVVVLPSRHRHSGPMSAIDLAVRADTPVVAPVSGVVVDAYAFPLYGGTDHKVWIRPDGNPAVLLSVIHVGPPIVGPGDRVEAGVTPIATAPRQLDFESQVDRFTVASRGRAAPHVHVELRMDDAA